MLFAKSIFFFFYYSDFMLKPWGNAKLIGYAFDFAFFFSCTRSSALRYILSFVYGEVPVLTLLDCYYVVDEEQIRTCSILVPFGASFYEFYPWNDKRNKVSPFYKWCLHLMSYYGSLRLPLIFLTALLSFCWSLWWISFCWSPRWAWRMMYEAIM